MSSNYRYSFDNHYYRQQHRQYQQHVFTPAQSFTLLVLLFAVPLLLLGGGSRMFRKLGLGVGLWRSHEHPIAIENEDSHLVEDDKTATPRKKHKSSSSSSSNSGYNYPGIPNPTHTTCFLNSTLQSLASLPHLLTYLTHVQSTAERIDCPTPIIDALLTLLQALNTPGKIGGIVKPTSLINALLEEPQLEGEDTEEKARRRQRAKELLLSNTHQDAQEFFQLLVESISAETADLMWELKRPTLALSSSSTSASQLGGNPFEGLSANRRTCIQCNYTESIFHHAFNCWSLTVPRLNPSSPIPLNYLLSQNTRLEILDDCICRKCSITSTIARIEDDLAQLSSSHREKKKEANGFSVLQEGDEKKSKGEKKEKEIKELERQLSVLRRMVQENRLEEDPNSEEFSPPPSHPSPSSSSDVPTPPQPPTSSSSKKKKKKRKPDPSTASSTSAPSTSTLIKLDKTPSRCSTKQMMIARPPQILTLHLNRSLTSHSGLYASKNTARVTFDDHLDLDEWVTGGTIGMRGEESMGVAGGVGGVKEESEGGSTTPTGKKEKKKDKSRYRYRLRAVVCHYGTHGWGHYIAFRRVPSSASSTSSDERWIRTSDSSVSPTTLEGMLEESCGIEGAAFMLYYELATPSPSSPSPAPVASLSPTPPPELPRVWTSAGLLLSLKRKGSMSSVETVRPSSKEDEQEEEEEEDTGSEVTVNGNAWREKEKGKEKEGSRWTSVEYVVPEGTTMAKAPAESSSTATTPTASTPPAVASPSAPAATASSTATSTKPLVNGHGHHHVPPPASSTPATPNTSEKKKHTTTSPSSSPQSHHSHTRHHHNHNHHRQQSTQQQQQVSQTSTVARVQTVA